MWVMDYETMVDCFVAVFKHIKTKQVRIFCITSWRNDLDAFYKFLNENIIEEEVHISYNGLAFDSQITQGILEDQVQLEEVPNPAVPIYKMAQRAINRSFNREWAQYPEWELSIKQLDIYKLNHWDNRAKMSSLKWIQYSMDWKNLQEMPIHHETSIKTQKELDIIVDYCINDVESTERIYNLSIKQVKLRENLSELYQLNLHSASETRISKELFLHFICKKLNVPKSTYRKSRTNRDIIEVKYLIEKYTKFNTKVFQDLLDKFKSLKINAQNTKGAFKEVIKMGPLKIEFGLGGVHGAAPSGIYESDADNVIMSTDAKSYYPNLAIRNGWAPAHLPKDTFIEQYKWFYDERVKLPKSNPLNGVYKLILNSTYGLSNDKYSFLYDPEYTMRVTINGQLQMMMLFEMIMENIPDAVPLLQNTDGVETIIPRKHKDKYMKICAEWEKITHQVLEHDEYKKLILADVNNYIGVFSNGKTKCKGRFEFEDYDTYEVSMLHKNKSALIVRKALHEYFVKGVKPEDYIKTNRNIFDYCCGVKAKGKWRFSEIGLRDGQMYAKPLQKIVRYYISHSGCKIVKENQEDGRVIQTQAGIWLQQEFNTAVRRPWDHYNVNDAYYLTKIREEIENITSISDKQQLKIF